MSGGYDGSIRFNTKIDDSSLGPQLNSLKAKLESASAHLRDVMQGPVQAIQMVGAAFMKVKGIVDNLEGEWAAQEKAVAVLEATLRATGASAWTSSSAINTMANRLQNLTGYADETIISMQNVLLGFKNIKGDNFKNASEQILNMAKVMNMDLTSAAQAVGKALDDPVQGMDSLTRQGFRFSNNQKEVLKQLQATGHLAEAQKIILDELTTTYGGAAEAANNTSSALKDKLKTATNELNESLGKFITDALAPMRRNLIEATNNLASWFKEINQNGNAAEILMKLGTAVGVVAAAVTAFVVASKGHAIVESMATAIRLLNAALLDNPYALAAAGIAALVVAIAGLKKAQDAHTESLSEALRKTDESKTRIKALADEYQNLYDKTNPTADEQSRMLDLATQLHEKLPDLTTDTINLASANGTLAAKAADAAKAQAQLNLTNFLAKIDPEIVEATKQFEIVSERIATLESGGRVAGMSKSDLPMLKATLEVYRKQIEALQVARENALKEVYGFGVIKPTVVGGTGGNGSGVGSDSDAVQIAKENYSKVEKLLESITFFNKRNSLHPYSEEEKKAFWDTARNQLFDIDALNLGPEALKLKEKVKDAIDAAFKVETPTFIPEGPGARGQSRLPPPGFSTEPRNDFYDQLLIQLTEEFKKASPQFGQSGIIPKGIAVAPSIAEQITALNALPPPPTVEEIAAEAAAYADVVISEMGTPSEQGAAYAAAVRKGMENWAFKKLQEQLITPTFGQTGIIPEGYAKGREDFAQQILDMFTEEFRAKEPVYGQSTIIPEGTPLAAPIVKQMEDLAAAVEAQLMTEIATLEDEYQSKQGSFGQTGIIPEGYVARSDFIDQAGAPIDRSIGSLSYERYLEEMSQKTALAPWQQAGIVGAENVDEFGNKTGEISGGSEIGNILSGLMNLGAAFSDSLGGIVSAVTSLASVQQILNPLTTIISAMMDVLGPVINEVLNPVVAMLQLLGKALGQILAPAIQLLTPIIEMISKIFVFLYNSVIVPIGNSIIKTFNWIYNGIVTVLNWLIRAINNALGWLGIHIDEIARRSLDQGTLTTVSTQDVMESDTADELKKQNDALKANKDLWSLASKAATAYTTVLIKVKSALSSFYESLQNVGADIADMIVNGIIDGFSDEDFVFAMQEYITKSVVKAAVFTETFMTEVAEIGTSIASGIANGFSENQLQALRDRLAALYTSAAASAEVAASLVESVFSSYDVGTLNVPGDMIARIHNKEMILEPGIAEEARRAGIFIGPTATLPGFGRASSLQAFHQPIRLSATGIINVDGREIGRVAFEYSDQIQRVAYGS